MISNFFIIGTQRSGTTLLRLILNAHSEIAIPEESAFLMPLLKMNKVKKVFSGREYENLISYILKDDLFRMWNYDSKELVSFLRKKGSITVRELIVELFASYANYEGKSIWGDKTPIFSRKVNVLQRLFPESVFIHIVRDGRDVFDSWRKMDPTKKNVAVAAIDWSYKNHLIKRALRNVHDRKKILVRYEDLLENPESAIKRICRKLGVEFEVNMLYFYKSSEYYIGKHHSKMIFKPINSSNKYKWKKTLKIEEVRVYNFLSRYYLRKYNYEIIDRPYSVFDYVSVLADLLKGIPYKLYQIYRAKYQMEFALRKGRATKYLSQGTAPSKRWNAKLK